MKIKFSNANVLDANFQILKNQDLVVEGNTIANIKNTDKKDKEKYDRVINCNENYLIPGFKNCHAHNAMVFVRSISEDLPLDRWLNESIFPKEAKLTEEDVYYFTILGIMESLASGITSCIDMYKYNMTLAEAYYHTGFRVNLNDSVTPFDKVIAPEENLIKINNYKDDKGRRVRYTLGLHAEYTNNKETFKMMSDLIHKYKVPYFTHMSETKKEVEECKDRWKGLSPVEVHEEYDMFKYGGGGYHCVYFSDKDIDIFKKHNLTIVTNPASNLKLASGIAPVKKYLEKGVNIAIGTDGPASNNRISMFREMYLASILSKYSTNNAMSIPTKDILKMVFENGAKATSFEKTESLKTGNIADIVMIDVHKANMEPQTNFINNLVYAAGVDNVKLTMVDGKILYEDGKYFINEDGDYIYKKCNELKEKLLER